MKYYLLKTNIFPHEFADGESVILIGNEDDTEEIKEDNLEFCTTLVVRSSKPEEALKEISIWWQENTSGKYSLELLTEEIEHLNNERKEHVLSLDEGAWWLKSNFIAFPFGDKESEKYAREIVFESEFKVQ